MLSLFCEISRTKSVLVVQDGMNMHEILALWVHTTQIDTLYLNLGIGEKTLIIETTRLLFKFRPHPRASYERV